MAYAYESQPVTEEEQAQIQKLREAFSALGNIIEELSPNGRGKSIAITHLETAAMWAIKAITHK